jgi:hypothetical protein
VAVTAPPAVPDAAVPITGAPGTVAGMTTADSAEFGPVPTALVAATWNWLLAPLVRPLTTRLVANAATWSALKNRLAGSRRGATEHQQLG